MGSATAFVLSLRRWAIRKIFCSVNLPPRKATREAYRRGSGRPNLRELFPQCPCDEEIAITEHVADRVANIAHQTSRVGLVPTARVHVRRQTAIETEAAVRRFGHGHHGRRHTVIPLNDRQGMMLVGADQEHDIGHVAAAEIVRDRLEFFQELTLLPTSQSRLGAANHFR
jgi:hypothetical protein